MNEYIIARRDSVKRLARRLGYQEYRAEDIAQEAALQLIANPGLISQRTKQAFIDALRGSGEASHRRSGFINVPIYESSFENYSHFIDGISHAGCEESGRIIRSDLLDIISSLKILGARERVIFEAYFLGDTMVEISERFAISGSRISQILKLSGIKVKKAVVSSRLSRQEQRKRKWEQSQDISRETQTRSGLQREVSTEMAPFPIKTIEGLVSFKIPKIPEALFASF